MDNSGLIVFGVLFSGIGYMIGGPTGLAVAAGCYLLFVIAFKLEKIITLLESIHKTNRSGL